MQITLFDRKKALCGYWSYEFEDFDNISVKNINFSELESHDCIVSPANSFGVMDGGFDLVLRDYFGFEIQEKVQKEIKNRYNSVQPVGTCIVIETGDKKFPYLAHTPTMFYPCDISKTNNIWMAFRILLIECKKNKNINSIACCGLGALTGRVPYDKVAEQMKLAYKSTLVDASINDWKSVNDFYRGIPFDVRLPNKETIEAIEESEALINDPNAKKYNSFEELLSEVENEIKPLKS